MFLTIIVNQSSGTNQSRLGRTSYWTNSLAVNPDGTWLSVVASDAALFHAQLSLVAQHEAMSQGKPFPEKYYYHRGIAINIVTSRLVHPVEAISDQTIGAVALLSNSDVSRILFHFNLRFRSTACAHSLSVFSDQRAFTELLRRAFRSAKFPHKGPPFSHPATGRPPYSECQ